MTLFVRIISFELNLIYTLWNFRGYIEVGCSLSFVIIFANLNTSFLLPAKSLSTKINVSLIYIPIMPNKLEL